MKKSLIHFFLFIFSWSFAISQSPQIDSMRMALRTSGEDTTKVNRLNTLSDRLWRIGGYDSSVAYANRAEALAKKLGYKLGILQAYTNIGSNYEYQSDYSKAFEYYSKALSIGLALGDKYNIAYELGNIGTIFYYRGDYTHATEYDLKAYAMDTQIGKKRSIAADLGNLGLVYHDQGNVPKALEYYFKGLKIEQELGKTRDIGALLGNIGTIYYEEGNYEKALDYSSQALAMGEKAGDKRGIATNLCNIANIYNDKGDIPKSQDYYNKALSMYNKLGDKAGIALVLGNMGSSYDTHGNYPLALEYENKALKIKREIGDKEGVAMNLANLGNIYFKQKNYATATKYLDSSLTLAKEIGEVEDIRNAYDFMAKVDSASGNFKTALEDYKKYIGYRDSLINEANTKKTVREQMNFEFEQKQAAEKAEQDKKDAISEQDRNKQKIIRNSFIGGFALMFGLAFFIFRGYRQKQKANLIITQQKEEVEKQKVLVEKQKALVEEKNKDILDSITYAKRLQDAILPPLNLIKQYLPESFVLYKPKDIVAGDFYWMEFIPTPILPSGGEGVREGIVLIAAADCTGHGVPGALVSVVCSNALNRAVKEFGITEPGKILDKVRELVLETFEKSESNVQDGMDISLAVISRQSSVDSYEVQWSGANNSLWYIQNEELKEIAPDKQPIGKYYNAKPFTTNSISLKKGDTLYLFTDGYADQFGGEKGKKFKYRPLQEKLLAISDRSLDEQKYILDKEFENWKGSLEQTDDVCVIGIMV